MELKNRTDKITTDTSIKEHWQQFKTAIMVAAETVLSKRTGKQTKEWISEEVMKLCERRR